MGKLKPNKLKGPIQDQIAGRCPLSLLNVFPILGPLCDGANTVWSPWFWY